MTFLFANHPHLSGALPVNYHSVWGEGLWRWGGGGRTITRGSGATRYACALNAPVDTFAHPGNFHSPTADRKRGCRQGLPVTRGRTPPTCVGRSIHEHQQGLTSQRIVFDEV
ncbi:hypothetical protein CDAR_182341 [Caerostris darwini]|uniref:Uncharacterized protein n=1 Tax=Caerostris darwini TaxID=1538125 RepID=A0AAV4U5L0_9ARAC|nr:hypothetical protein CDAR_182341 [Caerostris darwini]